MRRPRPRPNTWLGTHFNAPPNIRPSHQGREQDEPLPFPILPQGAPLPGEYGDIERLILNAEP